MFAETPQRSVLYVPSSNTRAIEKSAGIDADWLVYDLEDSVATEAKDSARESLISAFKKKDFGNSRTAIRCNAAFSGEVEADLSAVQICCPNAVLLPKVDSVAHVEEFHKIAEAASLDHKLALWFMIETSNGIVELPKIIESAADLPWNLSTLVVGHNDIASETGVSLENNRRYMIPWLMQIVLQAKANRLTVLDSVWNNFKDTDGLRSEAEQAKKMGFDGKTLIHPSQVEVATQVFSPSESEIDRARLIINTFSSAENLEKNVLNIDGEMVERLHLDQAKRLLVKAGINYQTTSQ